VSQAVLAAAALVLTACASGDDDDGGGITLPPPGTSFTVRVSDFPGLATVGGVARVIASPPLAIARTSAGYVSFSLICTHQGTQVGINGNNTLRCSNHGAEFTFDGRWTGGAQQTASLTRLTTSYDDTTGIARITI
jgi:Rieske Fe-S protein